MASAQRERISGVDTAWLRMDHPTNLMMIVGVMMFERKLDAAGRQARHRSRASSPIRRFRQKAVQDATGAWWETTRTSTSIPTSHRAALPRQGGQGASSRRS